MSRPFTLGERLGLWWDRRLRADEQTPSHNAARKHAALLAEDRLQVARERLHRYAGTGHPGLEAHLRANVANLEKEGDVGARVLELIKRDVLSRQHEMTGDADDVVVQLVDDPCVTASFRPFPDGSSVVFVYSGLLGLIDLIAKQFVLSAGLSVDRVPLLHDLGVARSLSRHARPGERLFAIDVALLRWTLLHQRVHGTAASLHRRLEPTGQRAVDALAAGAMKFVLGHECAHHILGHSATAHGPDARADAGDIDLERAADQRSLDLLDADDALGIGWAIGAVVAVTAVGCFESVTRVRAVHTHPPPEERIEAVLQRLTPARQALVRQIIAVASPVIDRALDLREPVSASYWKTMVESADVLLEPHTERDVELIFHTDQLMCGPLENADRVFEHIGQQEQLEFIAPVHCASKSRILAALPFAAAFREEMADPGAAPPFSELRRSADTALRIHGVQDSTSLFTSSIIVARLIASRIQEV